uniref:Uncharacterized protein n=1 Tax=Tetradesmus obliquus TaxID=3088 RepID=A0A383V8J0_TETOB|eukprot:jgi/Sobl393_1/3086/SZX61280.1
MGCDDDTRIAELRSDIIPRKDAAVQQILSQWQQQEQQQQQQDTSQNLLELLTYMQQELAALQQELCSLEARKLQEQQQDEAADAVTAQGQPKGEQQPAVIHLQILHRRHRHSKPISSPDGSSSSSIKTIETSSSQLDLARLEEQHAVKILKLLTTHDCEVPGEDQYEEAVMQLLTLEPGGHVWLIAQSTAASAVKAAAVSSACFLLQVEAALIALAVIKQQLRNVALTRGLRLVANNWARLGGWGVRLLWGQKPPLLMQPLLELGSMAQREMEQ